MKNAHNLSFVGEYYFTITCLQLIIQINVNKLKLFYVFNGFSWIRIRIFWYGSGSWSREIIRIPRIRIRNTDDQDLDQKL